MVKDGLSRGFGFLTVRVMRERSDPAAQTFGRIPEASFCGGYEVSPLLSAGLNDEAASEQDFSDAYEIQK